MSLTCTRCGQPGHPPPRLLHRLRRPRRPGPSGTLPAREAEGTSRVINEYRLNFMDPQHREMIKQATLDFLFNQKALNLPE